jgi:predicted Zn-dependent protease
MKNDISRRDLLKATAAFGAGGMLFSHGCSDSSLFAIPMSTMNSLGATSYAATMQEATLSQNNERKALVEKAGGRIRSATTEYEAGRGQASRLEGFEWKFALLKDDTINAWCMPGARIAFYEGILPLCESATDASGESGIGIVMGHEVAHAVYNHSGQRMAQQLAVQLGITALSVAIDKILNPDETVMQIALSVFGVGSQLGMLAYSRQHEYEADKTGLMYAAKAGYHPEEAVSFWERMDKLGGGSGPEFLSTHPLAGNRIQRLQEAMPEAMQHYEASKNR